MPCNICGCATTTIKSEGGIVEGEFTEVVECANGHTGTITGEAGNPKSWNYNGQVFADGTV